MAETIRNNLLQFSKVMRSAIKGNLKVGQSINSVFIPDFPFVKEADFYSIIRVDRRNGELKISTHNTELTAIHKIFATNLHASLQKRALKNTALNLNLVFS